MKKKKNGKRRTIIYTLLLVLVVIGICFACIPLFKDLKFGLDLQGGFEILYKATRVGLIQKRAEMISAL